MADEAPTLSCSDTPSLDSKENEDQSIKSLVNNMQNISSNLSLYLEFQDLKRKICPLFEILKRSPSNSFEEKILSEEDDKLEEITEVTITNAKKLREDLSKLINEKREESNNLWDSILKLREEIQNNEELQLGFTNAEKDIIDSMTNLKSQFEKRKKLKAQRIEDFIIQLREEILEIWNHCMITEEEKSEFKEFNSDDFSEDMLSIHKKELQKWRNYQEKNQELFDKVQRRKFMWKTLRELESRSTDPNRFTNRGGTLLKDQKQHAQLMKSLPKLESELKVLATRFEIEHGKKVRILGQEIPEMIEKEWKKFNDEKCINKKPVRLTRQSLAPSAFRNGEKRPVPLSAQRVTPAPKRTKLNE